MTTGGSDVAESGEPAMPPTQSTGGRSHTPLGSSPLPLVCIQHPDIGGSA